MSTKRQQSKHKENTNNSSQREPGKFCCPFRAKTYFEPTPCATHWTDRVLASTCVSGRLSSVDLFRVCAICARTMRYDRNQESKYHVRIIHVMVSPFPLYGWKGDYPNTFICTWTSNLYEVNLHSSSQACPIPRNRVQGWLCSMIDTPEYLTIRRAYHRTLMSFSWLRNCL